MGVWWSARAVRPMTVPKPQGIPKTAMAAKLYAGTVEFTSLAKDFCQNAVSYIRVSLHVCHITGGKEWMGLP